MKRWLPVLFGLLVGTVVVASTADPRGWSEGTPAVGVARVLTGPTGLPDLEFPKELAKEMKGPTLLFYFSPTCPHCTAVAAEVGQLERDVRGKAKIIGVASASANPEKIAAFKTKYAIDFEIVQDTTKEILAAMGVRSTPSMLFVKPTKAGKFAIVDVWYPYQGGFDAYVKMRLNPDAPFKAAFPPGEYQGNGSCGACHQQEIESWALTHHSVAWRTLVLEEKALDAECNVCHVTGANQPTGWNGDLESDLVDVGCEACHGPGGPHDGTRTDPATTCAGCHDEKHSISFTLEKAVPLIDHYLGNTLDDKGFTERRMALLNGEIERPLVKFGDGKTMGAEACKSCHEAEYAQWKGSGHHKAMQVLRDKEVEGDVACVKCHATAVRTGPPPAELDKYRIAEGVGCESCHGPGEDHVKAGGGTTNIEKLGDDCPVCVIEAVCTSCHTSEWDKDWDLDTHLPRAGHGAAAGHDGGQAPEGEAGH